MMKENYLFLLWLCVKLCLCKHRWLQCFFACDISVNVVWFVPSIVKQSAHRAD